jgi:hypothetical protein
MITERARQKLQRIWGSSALAFCRDFSPDRTAWCTHRLHTDTATHIRKSQQHRAHQRRRRGGWIGIEQEQPHDSARFLLGSRPDSSIIETRPSRRGGGGGGRARAAGAGAAATRGAATATRNRAAHGRPPAATAAPPQPGRTG